MSLVSISALLAVTLGCVFGERSAEAKLCRDGVCLEGYRCVEGICIGVNVLVEGAQDAGAQADSGRHDAGMEHDGGIVGDSGPGDDAGPVSPLDGGTNDAGPRDGGPHDAGPLDAAPPDDSGEPVDAGEPFDAGKPFDAGGPIDSGPTLHVLEDDDQADFLAGLFDATVSVDAEGVGVASQVTSATFTSRVLQSSDDVELTELRFRTDRPLHRPLPDLTFDDAEVSEYSAAGANMSDIVLVMHLDGTGAVDPTSLIDDATGQDQSIYLADNPPFGNSAYTDGRFGTSLHIEFEDYLVIDAAASEPRWVFGDGGFTWSAWFRTNGCVDGANNLIVIGGEVPHGWIGVDCPGDTAVMYLFDGEGGAGNVRPDMPLVNDYAWHHLVGVLERGPDRLVLYLDGSLVGQDVTPFGYLGNMTDSVFLGNFPLGEPPLWNYQTRIDVDEVGIWSRSLSATEVFGLYQRGAARVSFQVQACDGACGPATWSGVAATPDSIFSTESLATPSAEVVFPIPPGRSGTQFRYRVRFENDQLGLGGHVTQVRLSAE